MNKAVEKQISQIYGEVFKKIFSTKNINTLSKGSIADIFSVCAKLQSSKQYEKFCKMFAFELAKKGLSQQKGIWRKYFQAARKLNYIALPKTFNEFEAKIYVDAVKHNFNMIRSIPTHIMTMLNHKYVSTLMEEVAKGKLSRGSFERQLKLHSHKNAKLIARTETAKLQTTILQHRATDLGSVCYMWLSSKDKRTRQSHRDMQDVVVFWNFNKPLLDNMRGHAGEFPNCRCSPMPILDKYDLSKPYYKVYDYRIDKVIKLSKAELIEALNAGQLTK